jgi:hypothetical protein
MNTFFRYASFTFLLLGAQVFAQIPNASFEEWIDYDEYEDPAGWSSLNIVSAIFGGDLSCEREIPGAVGSTGVRISTVAIPGFGVLPGLMLAGEPNAAFDGFPYTQRPASLTGQWKAAVQPGDEAIVTVTLSRWNATEDERDIIGYGQLTVTGTVPNWTSFTVPIDYFLPLDPDTASILIGSSTGDGVAGSSISVDALAFGGATGISEAFQGVVSVFPVPALDVLHVNADALVRHAQLWTSDGRLVREQGVNADRLVLAVGDLPSGAYVLVARMGDGTLLRRTVLKH